MGLWKLAEAIVEPLSLIKISWVGGDCLMKRAVSISIGSSRRDKVVEIELLGEQIRLERIGTDGDMEKAARLYQELDGKVAAFGVGGALLGTMIDTRWDVMHSVQSLVRFVKKTPVVDGTGLKMTLEAMVANVLDQHIKDYIQPRRAFIAMGLDRWGSAKSFVDAGYEFIFGDLMFGLGLPIPIRSESSLKRLAKLLLPVVSRLPFEWVYPVGEAQESRNPKYQKYFNWATVVAGDCHYLTHYMPDQLPGKVVVTNTTTVEDREFFKRAGIKYLMTTTPILEGRSFGTNMMEAALVAAAGRAAPVDYAHPGTYFQDIQNMLDELHLSPQFQEL
jgi:hypothetical protein